jgi:ankyrin repeat protein
MLLQAVEERNPKRVQLLTDRGANVSLGSKDGLSPLLVAHLRADGTIDHDFENLLRSKGATLDPIMLFKWTLMKPILKWMSTGYP